MARVRISLLRVLVASGFIVLLEVLGSCFSPYKGDAGNLVIRIGAGLYDDGKNYSARAVDWSAEPVGDFTHRVTVSGGPGPLQYRDGVKDGERVIFNVPVGNWNVTIEGSLEGEPVSFGETNVDVRAGETTRAVIEMRKVETEDPYGTIVITFDSRLQPYTTSINIAGEGSAKINRGNGEESTHELLPLPENAPYVPSDEGYVISSLGYIPDGETTEVTIKGKITGLSIPGHNGIIDVNVENAKGLEIISIMGTSITSFNTEGLNALRVLHCNLNPLTEIDVSKNPALTTLDCSNNSLVEIKAGHTKDARGKLKELNFSDNANLHSIDVQYNELEELDFPDNDDLLTVICNNNQLADLDVSDNDALETLICNNNRLPNLDVSGNTLLETLNCDNNEIVSLRVSNTAPLDKIYCQNNQIDDTSIAGLVLSLPTRTPPPLGKIFIYGNDFPEEDDSLLVVTNGISEKHWEIITTEHQFPSAP